MKFLMLRRRALLALAILAPAFLVLAPVQPPALAQPAGGEKPSIVFILADDFSANLVPHMPNLLAMAQDGTSFANYFVTDSLCCPSRSSILTGKYPHNTGVVTNQPPNGGYEAFNSHGNEALTFGVALQGAGYRTAFLGKYLNGYMPVDPVPPGWSDWAVAGNGYRAFNYALNQSGRRVRYGRAAEDYLTDVIAGLGLEVMAGTPGPFFVEFAPFAPHAPYTPAPRDADSFPGLTAPRTAAFAARPSPTDPQWLQAIPALGAADIAAIDEDFRKRVQSVQAIDRLIGEVRAAVASRPNTYVVFSSDNGYHMGEHSLRPGKLTAFDTDIRVPLVIVGPGIAAGRVVDAIAANIDLHPTFLELAGAPAPDFVDGRSLVPLLRGEPVAEWRHYVLIEHRRPADGRDDPDEAEPNGGNPRTYSALRSAAELYVEYENGERAYYDLAADPEELRNVAAGLPEATRQRLADILQASRDCAGPEACWAAGQPGP